MNLQVDDLLDAFFFLSQNTVKSLFNYLLQISGCCENGQFGQCWQLNVLNSGLRKLRVLIHVGSSIQIDHHILSQRARPASFPPSMHNQSSSSNSSRSRNSKASGSSGSKGKEEREERLETMVSREHKRAALYEKLHLLRSITNSHAVIPKFLRP